MGNKSLVKAQHLVKHAWNVTRVDPVLSRSSTWRSCRHVEGCRYQTVVTYPCLDLYVSDSVALSVSSRASLTHLSPLLVTNCTQGPFTLSVSVIAASTLTLRINLGLELNIGGTRLVS